MIAGDAEYDTNGVLQKVELTKGGVQYVQSYVYVKAANDWQNGFVTTFNMIVDNPTCYYFDESKCKISFGICWWRSSEKVESRCGADGFAVIFRYSRIDGPGTIGGGLGYKGIYSAMAIEFDTFTNNQQNDPEWAPERHISVIIRRGENLADEKDRLAWNYRPLNFKVKNSLNLFLLYPQQIERSFRRLPAEPHIQSRVPQQEPQGLHQRRPPARILRLSRPPIHTRYAYSLFLSRSHRR